MDPQRLLSTAPGNDRLRVFILQPIPIDACKQEYNDCLNHYFSNQDITALKDLYLRLSLRNNSVE